ncbi:hypothetical protein SAMN04488563_3933 [Jiangella alkaliphila]|uniref:Uncharacterized protein n=1 Tax=Jiangella alkaliphila TaxID=419479 RepID=A0A1H2KKZ0_9ACTN|nr:hypothetical protein SAMN04488563_3933 [Jiangella alkaliphila]
MDTPPARPNGFRRMRSYFIILGVLFLVLIGLAVFALTP